MLRSSDAYGWRCSTSAAPREGVQPDDYNVDMDKACQEQYGDSFRSHYRDFSDPKSWYCA